MTVPSERTIAEVAVKIALAALGAILIVGLVLIWKSATDIVAHYLENLWCLKFEGTTACQLRGYEQFLIWIIIGIAFLLIFGFSGDWVARRYARPRE